MNAIDPVFVWPLTHLATALFFLLLGWRLGREASGRPMFDFPPAWAPSEPAGEEADPWAAAATGQSGPVDGLDRKETVPWS
jgi:hypothetical protein